MHVSKHSMWQFFFCVYGVYGVETKQGLNSEDKHPNTGQLSTRHANKPQYQCAQESSSSPQHFFLLLLPGAGSHEPGSRSPPSTVLEASEQRAIREESSRDHTKWGDQMTGGFKARKMIGLNKSPSSHSDNVNHAATHLLFLAFNYI